MKKTATLFIATMLIICASIVSAFAQRSPLERVWYNQEKTSKIKVFLATDGKYYGRIVWLSKPNGTNGSPRLDEKNSEEKLRSTPLLNLLILKGFATTTDANVLDGGTVYDPNNGKTYCGKLTLKGNELELRGFLCSMSIFGRTSTWTLAE